MKIPNPIFACLTTLCVLAAPLQADEYLTDQSEMIDPNSQWVAMFLIGPRGPYGFTPSVNFTPSTNSLDFVDLVTKSSGYASATLRVSILSETSVIDMSNELVVTNQTPATNRFFFMPSVPLVPGNTYRIQVRTLDNDWIAMGTSNIGYREGIILPAPVPPPVTIRYSHVDVCWSSRRGVTYQVQYRSELTTNLWTDLGDPIAGNGLTNCITDAVAGPQRFYRVEVLP